MILGKDLVVYNEPEDIYGDLFIDVQKSRIFDDNKAFLDLIPKNLPVITNYDYSEGKQNKNFNLKQFVIDHFDFEKSQETPIDIGYFSNVSQVLPEIWDSLERKAVDNDSSMIPLPFPFIMPGGRYNEQYYWDSYFIMLGLAAHGRWNMVNGMLGNITHMIEKFGYVPMANRTYFLSRSQPPFLSYMVKLIADHIGLKVLVEYLPYLVSEYKFWMDGKDDLVKAANNSFLRVVNMPDGSVLNRYFDSKNTPRAEEYLFDTTYAAGMSRQEEVLFYKNLRAGAESGWSFSSRWLEDPYDIRTINTTSIVPIDLNCLLYRLEETIADAYQIAGKSELSQKYHKFSADRLAAIQKYCWNENLGFFTDYNFEKDQQNTNITLAGIYPLFMMIASEDQAKKVAENIEKKFLKKGGLTTTLIKTEEKWDNPSGLAPLHWITIQGLYSYGFTQLAKKIKDRWVDTNTIFFKKNDVFVEKYDVEDPKKFSKTVNGVNGDGFAWTSGVLADLLQKRF